MCGRAEKQSFVDRELDQFRQQQIGNRHFAVFALAKHDVQAAICRAPYYDTFRPGSRRPREDCNLGRAAQTAWSSGKWRELHLPADVGSVSAIQEATRVGEIRSVRFILQDAPETR